MPRSYWAAVAEQFPMWQQVYRGEVTAGEVRRDFIHTHSIVLHALGGRERVDPDRADPKLGRTLKKLRRSTGTAPTPTVWEGRATLCRQRQQEPHATSS